MIIFQLSFLSNMSNEDGLFYVHLFLSDEASCLDVNKIVIPDENWMKFVM